MNLKKLRTPPAPTNHKAIGAGKSMAGELSRRNLMIMILRRRRSSRLIKAGPQKGKNAWKTSTTIIKDVELSSLTNSNQEASCGKNEIRDTIKVSK